MSSYDPKSLHAEEFINDAEILDSLAWADRNKNNKEVIEQILEKARQCRGLSHREASALLACETGRGKREDRRPGRADQEGLLRQPHRHVRAPVPVQLLRERLRVLPLSPPEQAHPPQKADPGGGPRAR